MEFIVYVPKQRYAVIAFCQLILEKDANYAVTTNDLEYVRKIIQEQIDTGLSPKNIQEKYELKYSNFGMFLKRCLGIKLKSVKDANINYINKIGRTLTDAKKIYQNQCSFTFDPYVITNIKGFHLLKEFNFYHSIKNPNGVCRDHIVSIENGWRNNIDPKIISHPANCQYLTNIDNLKKGSSSGMSLDELLTCINNWDNNPIQIISSLHKQLPKSQEHKDKIRKTNLLYMNVTNGLENKRIHKTDNIPNGFWRGMTRKRKL